MLGRGTVEPQVAPPGRPVGTDESTGEAGGLGRGVQSAAHDRPTGVTASLRSARAARGRRQCRLSDVQCMSRGLGPTSAAQWVLHWLWIDLVQGPLGPADGARDCSRES